MAWKDELPQSHNAQLSTWRRFAGTAGGGCSVVTAT